MNPEAVRTGRRTTSTQRVISAATSSSVLTGAAPNRVAILISAPSTNRFTLSLETTAVLDQGLTVYPTRDIVALTIEEHGDMVARPWAVISATATQNVTIVEVFLV